MDEQKRVITAKRNIQTSRLKQGKYVDAYFQNDLREEKTTLDRLKKVEQIDRENYINKAKSRKKGSSTNKFCEPFRPSSGTREWHD